MNVIFIPADRLFNIPAINSSGHSGFTVSAHGESIDYAQGLYEFGSVWDGIDGHTSNSYNYDTITSYDLRAKFWDRFEFLNLLKATCLYDVYIKAVYDSLQLNYVSSEDRVNVQNKIRNRSPLSYLDFNSDLKPAILVWLKNNGVEEYRIISGVGSALAGIKLFLRDPHFETLARVKFSNTQPEDHVEHEPEEDVPF